jgi:2-deoxy-D-gluconate 3-dehydrogenase
MKVLLTGASRGIGKAVGELLAARGAQLALAVREPAAVQQLMAAGGGSAVLPVDLRDRAAVAELVPRAVAALGGLDGLINCAGVVQYRSFVDVPLPELLEQFEINTFAPFVLAQAAGRHLAAHGGGAIVNVASTLGLRPASLTAAYAASKAALISLTRSLALELGSAGVRVNAIAPGVIDTQMVRVPRAAASELGREAQIAAELEQLRRLHPLGRLGTAAEIAEAVVFLMEARFVTGSVWVVDGGVSLA